MKTPGVFCISLDFELHWGTFETVDLNPIGKKRFENTRRVIPQLLQKFAHSNVQVTWAAVGMLFNENATEWQASRPEKEPVYLNRNVSSYAWADDHGFESPDSFAHFAPELIRLILQTPGMELGSHTYSHFYCNEPGQTAEDFRTDLQLAKSKASAFNIELKSLVFPRNHFNADYLNVCRDEGILSVRSNPNVWFWDMKREETTLKKGLRSLDTWLPLGTNGVIPMDHLHIDQQPLCIPASRFFKPWNQKKIINRIKMRNIKKEMEQAAISGGLFHLWWHPHNFGTHPEECLLELDEVLEHYNVLRETYGFISLSMDGIRSYIMNKA